MASRTPFFAAFASLLFGKPRLSNLEKLLRLEGGPAPSLSQYQAAFGAFIPQALLAPEEQGVNSRSRMFPPLITFWAFLAQVLERGSSCRDALRRITAWRQFEYPKAPLPSPKTGGYCSARARLALPVLEQIGTHLADQLERHRPAGELWQGRRVKIIDGTTASMADTPENQALWPQSHSQKPGCGFPLVKLVALF